MRRRSKRVAASAIAFLVIGPACAHVEPPAGGPEDLAPPAVLTVRPEAEAILPGHEGPVVFVFDERISEQTIDEAVSVSPRTSPVEVRHGRDEIRVSLRRGWEPGTIYHVVIGRDVRDLFNNRLAEPIRLVFSTGPPIPGTAVSGSVIDWITGEAEAEIRVEAIRTDSLVYAAVSDSTGAFQIEQFPEGDYLVRAFRDLNDNRALDGFEVRDSASVTVVAGTEIDVQLRVVPPDSSAPVPGTATAGEGRVSVEFDDYLDPEQDMEAVTVTVSDDGGASLPVAALSIGEPPPAVADTAQIAAAPDTVAVRPSRRLVVGLAEGTELAPGTDYTIIIDGIRNVVGLRGGGEVMLSLPEPPTAP